jgi:hypothetical protein
MSLHALSPSTAITAENALILALRQAGLSQHDLIHVAGAGALAAMLWLCRRGYHRVQHLCLQSPSCGAEAADALLIPHLVLASDLSGLLQAANRVRDGGALIVRTGARLGSAEIIAALAGPFRYEMQHQFADKGRALYVGRREPRLAALKVA